MTGTRKKEFFFSVLAHFHLITTLQVNALPMLQRRKERLREIDLSSVQGQR